MIKLTMFDDRELWVNPEHISAIHVNKEPIDSNTCSVYVAFDRGGGFSIKESVNEVKALMSAMREDTKS